jgi:tetratricopeptide (TPR) repeat protein
MREPRPVVAALALLAFGTAPFSTAATDIDPRDADAYTDRGIAWHRKGEFDKAIADYSAAIRIGAQPSVAIPVKTLPVPPSSDFLQAIPELIQGIKSARQFARAYVERGDCWRSKGEFAKALSDFNEAIRLEPRNAAAYSRRAWVSATCPDPRFRDGVRAVELARRACELTQWNEAGPLGTLAAAAAETGDFDTAVKWQEKAISLSTDESERSQGRTCLELYRARKPYREPLPARVEHSCCVSTRLIL